MRLAILAMILSSSAIAHEGHLGSKYRVELDGVWITNTYHLDCVAGSTSSWGQCKTSDGWGIRSVDSEAAKAFSRGIISIDLVQARTLTVFDITHSTAVVNECVLPAMSGSKLYLLRVSDAKNWKRDDMNPELLQCKKAER